MNDDTKQMLWVLIAVVGIIGVSVYGIAGWFTDSSEEEEIQGVKERQERAMLQFVSGTEYVPGQEGQVAILLVNVVGTPVTFSFDCNYTVLYPNKTVFVQGNFTQNTSVDTLYTNFTVPDVEGVYEYSSVCTNGGQTATAGKSFHVSRKQIRAVIPK